MSKTNDQNALYKQDTDLEILKILLPHLKQRTFIDIGAEKGTFTVFLSELGLKGTFFEPLPKFETELKEIAAKTGCTFLPYAVDQVDRTAAFYAAADHADNSMDYFSSLHPLNDDARISHKEVATVTCRSLDSLYRDNLIAKEYGIVKVDTEGNDLNVLKGMQEIKAEVLMCEYFMPGIYAGWELGHPHGLIEAAKKLGFHHYLAIKRIDHYELVSKGHTEFMEKQWGNIIFISDAIFTAAKPEIDALLIKKECELVTQIMEQKAVLENICKERLDLIHQLDRQLKSITGFRGQSHKFIVKLKDKIRNWK